MEASSADPAAPAAPGAHMPSPSSAVHASSDRAPAAREDTSNQGAAGDDCGEAPSADAVAANVERQKRLKEMVL